MGHLLASVNPQAVDRVEERPLPEVGDWILYYPRMGERRRGRVKVPALVVHRDESNRRLDLAIFHEATDVLDQQNVPERVGEDRGWLRKEPSEWASALGQTSTVPSAIPNELTIVRQDIEAIKAGVATIRAELNGLTARVFGDIPDPPKESVLEMLGILDNAIDEIEAKIIQPVPQTVAPPPVTFKRRGRPPKNAPPKVA